MIDASPLPPAARGGREPAGDGEPVDQALEREQAPGHRGEQLGCGRELGVARGGDDGERLGDPRGGRVDLARGGVADRQQRGVRGPHRTVVLGGGLDPLRPLAHLGVLAAQVRGAREVRQHARGGRTAGDGRLEGAVQAPAGRVVTAQQPLDAGAGHRQPRVLRALGGMVDDLERGHQPSGLDERPHQRCDLGRGRIRAVGGEQPVRRDARGLRPHAGRRGAQRRGGLDVTGRRRMGQVLRAHGRRGACRRQLARRRGVAGEPRPGAQGVVHRGPHDRVAEGEAPGVAGGAHQALALDDVQRAERGGLVERRDPRREVEVEGVAGDRGSLDQGSRVAGEGSDLGPDRGDDPAGQLVGAAVARELGQQQRIAARRPLRGRPVAFVEERMTAELHDGSGYENDLCMRVTFREGRIAEIYEYYGERAHEDMLRRLGAG